MADKEQIMIDLNVQECKFWQEGHCDCFLYENRYPHCLEFPNCDYKQLVRKTQEYEKYKKLAADFKDVNKQLGYKYLTIKKKCEELKEKYEEVKEDRYNLNMEMYVLDRYHKALEEIEKLAKDQVKWAFEASRKRAEQILNIINEAKGGGECQ